MEPFRISYSFFLGLSLFFDVSMHFTPFVAFFRCRVDPSLKEAITFALFGKREFNFRAIFRAY
jgi:hypothetical protein